MELLQRETRLRVAAAKATGAMQQYAESPCASYFQRAVEFLHEAEVERMELMGFESALKSFLNNDKDQHELTAAGAAVLTDAELSA